MPQYCEELSYLLTSMSGPSTIVKVGLCHVSQLSEEKIDDIEARYQAGDRVTVKILKVDEDRHRVSLGMKDSYFSAKTDTQTSLTQMSDDSSGENQTLENDEIMSDDVSVKHHVLSEVESRASVLPLEVTLDDTEYSPMNKSAVSQSPERINTDNIDEKKNKRAKKKEKEQREREISAAEERLIEEDIPRTPDEFEKLIRNSPNSSFLWIKYIEFMLFLSDVEKARSIAESLIHVGPLLWSSMITDYRIEDEGVQAFRR